MQTMKIAVTGALGHIGSRLLRDLPDLMNPPLHFLLIDNLHTQRYASLFELPKTASYEFCQDDVCTMPLQQRLAGYDAVIHLAAITDAAASFHNQDAVERNNLGATSAVARACANLGIPLWFPSTTSVYGSQSKRVNEECANLHPQSPYAASKLREEQCLSNLGCSDGLTFVICRLGTIAGVSPGMRFHTAVNRFAFQAAMRQPLTVWRTAYDQKRPYLALDDAARAVAFFLHENLFDRRIYNVVTANHTVREIVAMVQAQVPELELTFVDNAIMNQLSYEVDGSRLQKAGFVPVADIGHCVAQTLAHLPPPIASSGARQQQPPSGSGESAAA